jgi:energy-coupling factor transporter ATP-binding protein EcfA2
MALRIVTADERLSEVANKTTMALFGPSGVGKTTLVTTLPHATTLCVDLEAGMKSVQDWPGDSIPVRSFEEAIDLACLIGGVNPAADPNGFFSAAHHQHLVHAHPDLVRLIASKTTIFLDSITDLTRQAMAWAKTRPEAFSEKTGRPDTRGAYGLMAREVIGLLKHLQHAPGKVLPRRGAV